MQALLIFQHDTCKNGAYFDMDRDGCPIDFLIWGEMDLDSTLRDGLEMGLKICPMKTSTAKPVARPKSQRVQNHLQ